ncbi:hypothetical protein SLE2022_060240 [Rubroshorea leprosula]
MDMKRLHSPSIMLIVETKIGGDQAKAKATSLGFPKFHIVDSDGLAGGLWLLWNDYEVLVDVVATSSQAIHAVVKVTNQPLLSSNSWFLSSIYGRPTFEIRTELWQELGSMSRVISSPWMIIGDFNDVVDQSEKFGGGSISQTRVCAYLNCMNDCNMQDLGYVGSKFTWVNMRFNGGLIRERLDRAWANPDWRICFPQAFLLHLPRFNSDHHPVMLCLNSNIDHRGSRPFRLEKFWLDHPSFGDIISPIWSQSPGDCLNSIVLTTSTVKQWSKATFGNIFKEKRDILRRLKGIHQSPAFNHSSFLIHLEKDLSENYEKLLKHEEDLWFMKSRSNWNTDGDRNTKFFHLSTIRHRARNKILGLKDSRGDWIFDSNLLQEMVSSYFSNLFMTSHSHSYTDSFSQVGIRPIALSLDSLVGVPTDLEIYSALHSLKPFKAPGPDGFHPLFFQKFWNVTKDKLCADIKHIFMSEGMLPTWNETLITLIPKNNSPVSIKEFRPIGLCNTTYKIVSKILVARIKPFMDRIISPCQTSFVPGRKGTDNILILQELVHSFAKKKGKCGDFILKLDLEKAYDRLEWGFIHEALCYFNFPPSTIKLIMSCVCTTSISILLNGNRTDTIYPSRGIRQGDPLSPYLFILCMEFLALKIFVDMDSGIWKGSKAGRSGPVFSHLFFADDVIFVGKATLENCNYLVSLLDFFCSRSGQNINHNKSRVLFSTNVEPHTRNLLCNILGVTETNDLGKYLGIPISPKKLKKSQCQFIIDKVRSKLVNWKTNFLSFAGRVTLTRAVLDSVPSYYMQSSLLPVSVHSELDHLSRNFIWGSDEQHRKIHLIKWDTVCQPRHLGGLGLKKSRDANIVAMCKLNWRLHSEKSNTWSKLFCRKYSIVDPRDPLPNHGSPTLQAMKEGRSLFQRGLRWIPRNGNSIFFWNDCWVGNQPLSKVFYGPHLPSSDSLLLADVLLDGSTSGIAYHLPQELLAQMQAIPIATNTTLEDNFSWIGSSNGNFSPSSALCLLRDLPTTKDCTWSWIWKVVTLPKIQFFIWLLSHCRLKSLAFLHRLNISPSPNCPRCHDAEETIDHIFRGCPLSIHLWNLLLPGAIVPGEYSTFTSWLKANLVSTVISPVFSIPWGTFFSFIIWGIWLFRNQVLYRDVNTSLQSWSTSITFRAIDFWSSIPPPVAMKTRTQGLFAWSKPSLGCIKLNTDGASEGNPGPAGAGGVFRDHLGNFIIGFSRKVGFATSLAAELWATRDGLLIAIHRGFNNLIVESDSKTAISMITAGSYNCHHLSTLILDCRELLCQFENVQIVHAVRECNMTADCFARMGTTLSSPSFCIFESCPPSAAFFCCADAYGVCFARPP